MIKRKRFKKTGKNTTPQGLRVKRRKFPDPAIETNQGIKVRSKNEQICVDFFCENGIKFQYEPLIIVRGRQYRPDFFLLEHNLFIEICGFGHMPYYNLRVTQKKQVYQKANLNCLFIEYNGKGSLRKLLAEIFEEAGVLSKR